MDENCLEPHLDDAAEHQSAFARAGRRVSGKSVHRCAVQTFHADHPGAAVGSEDLRDHDHGVITESVEVVAEGHLRGRFPSEVELAHRCGVQVLDDAGEIGGPDLGDPVDGTGKEVEDPQIAGHSLRDVGALDLDDGGAAIEERASVDLCDRRGRKGRVVEGREVHLDGCGEVALDGGPYAVYGHGANLVEVSAARLDQGGREDAR